jgi:hypothetical protein
VRGTKYFQFGIAAQALKSCSYIVASVFSAHATSRTHFYNARENWRTLEVKFLSGGMM